MTFPDGADLARHLNSQRGCQFADPSAPKSSGVLTMAIRLFSIRKPSSRTTSPSSTIPNPGSVTCQNSQRKPSRCLLHFDNIGKPCMKRIWKTYLVLSRTAHSTARKESTSTKSPSNDTSTPYTPTSYEERFIHISVRDEGVRQADRPGATGTRAAAALRPECVQFIGISRPGVDPHSGARLDPGAYVVAGGDLRLGFAELFLRDPGPDERDVISTEQMLRGIAVLVWLGGP